jgi:hypothetical protein
MPLQEISVDSAAALAMEFVRSSCSSKDVAAAAKAVDVRMLLFQPKKRVAIWEELFCASAGMAYHSIAESSSSRVAIKVAQTVFEVEVFRQAKTLLGSENEAANPRFHQKIRAYKAALLGGQDAIGLSSLFLENLREIRRSLEGNTRLQLVPILASMQMAMRDGMKQHRIALDNDDNDDEDV